MSFAELRDTLFDRIRSELRTSKYPEDHMIAHKMAIDTDTRAYYAHSRQTVRESDSGVLLREFLAIPVSKLFLYGEANRTLSYLPTLRQGNVDVREIPKSGHFLFYGDPVTTSEEIGRFVKHTT